jgi:hypothetical protein
MINAKEELLEAIKATDLHLDSAVVFYQDEKIILKDCYCQEETNKFFKILDFEYDSDFGTQELFGTVLLSEGAWLERGEYNGSEWWELKTRPNLRVYFEDPEHFTNMEYKERLQLLANRPMTVNEAQLRKIAEHYGYLFERVQRDYDFINLGE